MKEELVSVIVPVYNSEKYLRECVDSIINQTYSNLDIILVDDGSTDSSGDICDMYAKHDDRVRVIHKKNGGNGDARNTGLKEAKGKWIAMSDNDDIMHKRQIEILLTAALKNDADISVGWYRPFDVGETPEDEDVPADFINSSFVLTDKHLYDDKFIKKYTMILAVPWSKICKREIYEGVEYPSKSRHDDAWTTWKLYEKSRKTVFTPIILHYWRDDPNSFGRRTFDTSHFDGMDAYKTQIEYYHKAKKQRYVEITFASYLETFFWCYNHMQENQMDLTLLKPYHNYIRSNISYIKLSRSLGLKQWIRYRYLVWYKIPKIIKN